MGSSEGVTFDMDATWSWVWSAQDTSYNNPRVGYLGAIYRADAAMENIVGWWNSSWNYRYKVTINETNIIQPDYSVNVPRRINFPIDIPLTFADGTCHENSIRVTYYNGERWNLIQSQIWNKTYYTTYLKSCTVYFPLNISIDSVLIYYIYFDPAITTPDLPQAFPKKIWAIPYNRSDNDAWSGNDNVTVYYANGTKVDMCDTLGIFTQTGRIAQIDLIDTYDYVGNWGGPSCSLIEATYNGENVFWEPDFPNDPTDGNMSGYNVHTIGSFLVLGNIWLWEPTHTTRHSPDNPTEAWDVNKNGLHDDGNVTIEEDGPLFVRIKIVTTDGGFEELPEHDRYNINYTHGYLNYTFYWTFYYYGPATFVKIDQIIQAQRDIVPFNIGDFPHLFAICSENNNSVNLTGNKQNSHAWVGVLTEPYSASDGVYNESAWARRIDYPLESWAALYDNESGQYPGVGLITINDLYGWEINSLVNIPWVGNNLMLQPIFREGWGGGTYTIYNQSKILINGYLLTDAFGENYKNIREMSFKLNNLPSIHVDPNPEFHNSTTIEFHAFGIENQTADNITIYIYNSTHLIDSKTTDQNGNATFTGLLDGTYTVNATISIEGTPYLINETTISLDHTLSRGKNVNLRCNLTSLKVIVVDWYDNSLLEAANVSLYDYTSKSFITSNLTLKDVPIDAGTCSFWLPTGITYQINVTFGGEMRITNQSPYTLTSSTELVIGCIVTSHLTELQLAETNATDKTTIYGWWECSWQDSIYFKVYYNDTQAIFTPTGISGATLKTWVLKSGSTVVDSGNLNEVIGEPGNYSFILNANYLPDTVYRLEFSCDKDFPADFYPGYLDINFKIKNWSTEATSLEDFSLTIPWGETQEIHIFYADTHLGGSDPIPDAQYSCDWDAGYYSFTVGNGWYNLTIDSTSKNPNELVTLSVTLRKTNYTFQTLYYSINVRARNSELTYTTPAPVPIGNNITIDVYFKDLDNSSQPIGNETGQVSITLNSTLQYWVNWETGTAHYQIIINSSYYLSVNTWSIKIDVKWFGAPYHNNRTAYVNAIVRNLTTSITATYFSRIPWGNGLNMTLTYFVNDVESIYNGQTIDGATINISNNNFIYDANYSVIPLGSGQYLLMIYNNSFNGLPVQELPYSIDVWAGNVINYAPFTRSGLIFFVENLSTTIETIVPLSPWDNDVNITVTYKVSDSASLYHDGEPISTAIINITNPHFVYGVNYTVYNLGAGNYILQIFRSAFGGLTPTASPYSIEITASGVENYSSFIRSNVTFSIRKLVTDIQISPVSDVPYGNEANITVHIIYSDPESTHHGEGLNVASQLNISPPHKLNFVESLGNGYYKLVVNRTTLMAIGSYEINVTLQGTSNYTAASKTITFSVRPLNTRLTYIVPEQFRWGTDAIIEFNFNVSDTATLYYSNLGIDNANLTITTNGWTYGINYTVSGGNGVYFLRIFNNSLPYVQKYEIDVKAFAYSDIYSNASYTSLPFFVRRIYTSYAIQIQDESVPSMYGIIWGTNVTVKILYNDTETQSPISTPLINLSAPSPYSQIASGINGSIVNYNNGTFLLFIDGNAAEHATVYEFNILLFTSNGLYVNQSFSFSISFRKYLTSIFIKSINYTADVFSSYIPWGDNVTILFTYNNTELPGNPGIPNADLTVEPVQPWIQSNYTLIQRLDLGPGAWEIIMNTTCAPTGEVETSFLVKAQANNTIYTETEISFTIRPINTKLSVISWDYSIWKEKTNNFNITLKLTDLDHNYAIENNSYYPTLGSPGQYTNIRFTIETKEGIFSNYTWYYGNITVFDSTALGLAPGTYRLMFTFDNSTQVPPGIPEKLNYWIAVYANGTHIATSSSNVTVNIKIKTHQTNITFSYTEAQAICPYPLAPFSYIDNSTFIFQDKVNITFFWYDRNAENVGITGGRVTCNWTPWIFYRVFDLYEVYGNDSYRGLYTVQIDTDITGKHVVGQYVIEINASLETYLKIYNLSQIIVHFTIDPVPVNLTLVNPIEDTPWGDTIELQINYTNFHKNNEGILIYSSDDINITNFPADQWELIPGVPGIYTLKLFSPQNIFDLGTHVITIQISQQNYQEIIKNFTFTVRPIKTRIQIKQPQLSEIMYRGQGSIQFYYIDDEDYRYHTNIGFIPLADYFNLTSGWKEFGGQILSLDENLLFNYYEIQLGATLHVGNYTFQIYCNKSHYYSAETSVTIEVTPAPTEIIPLIDFINVYQLEKPTFSVLYKNYYNETITNGTLQFFIYDKWGNIVDQGTLIHEENGTYSATIKTGNLWDEDYNITIIGIPNDENYADTTKSIALVVKPFYTHWLFILGMVIIGAVAGFMGYRQIRWMMLPYQVKEIIKAKKKIKKNKPITETKVVMDREEMFASMFKEAWDVLALKPPKLVKAEVIAFAHTLSSILRVRVTHTEAQNMIQNLQALGYKDAQKYLGDLGVPPEGQRRLLEIAKLVKHEREVIVEFMQALAEIKDMDINYTQAEEIYNTIRALPPADADSYLEKMVIPKAERKRLLELAKVEEELPGEEFIPFAGPQKPKKTLEERIREKREAERREQERLERLKQQEEERKRREQERLERERRKAELEKQKLIEKEKEKMAKLKEKLLSTPKEESPKKETRTKKEAQIKKEEAPPPTKEEPKPKEKPIKEELPKTSLSESELAKLLERLGLSEQDLATLIEYLKTLPYEQQKRELKNMGISLD
ncbi:MAG: MSCRAMM family protein [Candidatus Helarchaeota archaeon]